MTIRPMLEDLIVRFNRRMENDEQLQNELDGMRKSVQLDLDSEQYHFMLENRSIDCLCEGKIENPDITLISDPETLQGIIEGKIKPIKAFALRKVRIKGQIEDMLRLRKLFS